MSRKKKLTRRDYSRIENMAANGHPEYAICRALNIGSPHTWSRIKKEDERAVAALEAGRAAEHQALYGKLYEKAMNGETVALLFLLKTRHGYVEGEKPAEPGRVQVTFNLPAPLKPEQYGRTIEHEGASNGKEEAG